MLTVFILADKDHEDFNPQVSASVATLLTLICLFVFIYFIQNTLEKIQAENAIYDCQSGLHGAIETYFPELDPQKPLERAEAPPTVEWTIPAGSTGYIQAVGAAELLKIASSQGLVVSVPVRAGDFVTPQSTILRVIESSCLSSDIAIKTLRGCFYIGRVRTPEQDIEYGIRQLVEVGVRALSPGVNDPFTAIDCIDYLGSGLQSIFARELPKSIYRDDDTAEIRVYCSVTSYEGLLGTAVNQMRQNARRDCSVTCRLLYMLRGVAISCRTDEQRTAVAVQAELIWHDADSFNEFDTKAIETRYDTVIAACGKVRKGGKTTAGPEDSRETSEGV